MSAGFIDDYLPYLLARASHRISSEFHAVVAQSGLSPLEWRVLASLSGRVERSIGELAQIVLAQQPTVTKLVVRMEAQGLLVRRAGPTDRRQALVRLSPAGRRKVAPLLRRARTHERQVLAALGPAHAQDLKRALDALITPPA